MWWARLLKSYHTAASLPLLQLRKTNADSFPLSLEYTSNAVVKKESPPLAHYPFDETPRRNPTSQNAVLSAHIRSGRPEAAWLLFRHMHHDSFYLDSYTFTPALRACSILFDVQLGKQAHALLIRTGTELEIVVKTALLDMYIKCGRLDDAVLAFRETRSRDVVAWNAMISGFVQHGRDINAVAVFQEMQQERIGFSGFTLCSMLQACVAMVAPNQGKQIHALSIVSGDSNSVVLATALIDLYMSCQLMGDAVRVFQKMNCRKDEAVYNTLISGCVQNRKYEEAFSILVRMQPNAFALTSALAACSDLLDLSKGKQMHCIAIRRGFESSTLLSNALLDMYAKCGMITIARLIFDQIGAKNVVSWTSIIDAYGRHGRGVEALEMFKKMGRESSGIVPNSVTFLSVLSACSHSGLVEEARDCFVLMRDKYGLDPGSEHYACFIDLLGRAGQIDEVWDLARDISSTEQPAAVWAALLTACRADLDVVRGEMAAKHLLGLEPANPGNYVLLSNFYAAIGRWEAVEELRMVMKEKGLRKGAGRSWVAAKS